LTIFSPGLLRVPVVCLIFHSSVVTMSNKPSLSKYRYLDPQALTLDSSAFFRYKDGTHLVELRDLKIDRLNGGLLCGINSTAICNEGHVIGCHIRDWMLQTESLQNSGLVLNDKAVGSHRRNGSQFLRRFIFADTIMEHTGLECGASRSVGNNQSGVLVNGYGLVGGNMYLGIPKGISAGVGEGSVLLRKSDMT
ncbi:hypothetical protein, partial [Roseobacter sp.]|uniref:hypothetical protein n=1 Tax=Roseobacter sp. TaxID=1907202 RepID=UPI003859473B